MVLTIRNSLDSITSSTLPSSSRPSIDENEFAKFIASLHLDTASQTLLHEAAVVAQVHHTNQFWWVSRSDEPISPVSRLNSALNIAHCPNALGASPLKLRAKMHWLSLKNHVATRGKARARRALLFSGKSLGKRPGQLPMYERESRRLVRGTYFDMIEIESGI